jgi:hypothetical protein
VTHKTAGRDTDLVIPEVELAVPRSEECELA